MSSQGTDLRKRAILSGGQGVLTAVYYATPDFISSKGLRGVVKTILAVGVTALAASEYDDLKRDRRSAESNLIVQPAAQAPGELIGGPGDEGHEPHPTGAEQSGGEPKEKSFSDFWVSLPPARRATLGGLGFVGALVTVAGIAAAERGIYRFSERRAERGVVAAHTKTGLVISGLTTLLALIPPPKDK